MFEFALIHSRPEIDASSTSRRAHRGGPIFHCGEREFAWAVPTVSTACERLTMRRETLAANGREATRRNTPARGARHCEALDERRRSRS
jgi:hypothetical protein